MQYLSTRDQVDFIFGPAIDWSKNGWRTPTAPVNDSVPIRTIELRRQRGESYGMQLAVDRDGLTRIIRVTGESPAHNLVGVPTTPYQAPLIVDARASRTCGAARRYLATTNTLTILTAGRSQRLSFIGERQIIVWQAKCCGSSGPSVRRCGED